MTFAFEGLIGASISLAIVYLFLLIYVSLQLYRVHHRDLEDQKLSKQRILKNEEIEPFSNNNTSGRMHEQLLQPQSTLNTKKLFIMTCLLSCLLRLMSFSSMFIVDISALRSSTDFSDSNASKFDDGVTGTEIFFEKAFLVLFDFPDFCIISAYCLLIVVWGEAYLQSRRHWLSSIAFRRFWILSYLLFNICLYGCQVGLYTLLFIPTVDKRVLSIFVYLTLTAYNLVLPMLWLVTFVYLSIKFSGFPYASGNAQQRLSRLGSIVVIWTISRIGWGFLTLTTVMQGWLDILSTTNLGHTIILVAIFLFAEVLPIIFSIQSSMIGSLTEESTSGQSIVKMYNTFEPHITPDRRLSFPDDYYSSASPMPLPMDHHSWFWTSKTPITLNKSRNDEKDELDAIASIDHMVAHLAMQQPSSPNIPSSSSSSNISNHHQSTRPLSTGGRSRQSSSISDSIDIERHYSTDSFVSARGFPLDMYDSRSNSYDDDNSYDNESFKSGRSGRRKSNASTRSTWRSWIFGD